MSDILIFAGSSRVNSVNRKLAKEAARMVREAGSRATYIELSELNIPLYNGDLETRGTPGDVMRLKELMHQHAGWIIASPEYNGSYSSLLKNTIDWASRPATAGGECTPELAEAWKNGLKPFAGKVVGLMSASPGLFGGLRGLDHLAPLLMKLQCWVAPQQFALPQAMQAFDAQGQLKDAPTADRAQTVVRQVLWAASRFKV